MLTDQYADITCRLYQWPDRVVLEGQATVPKVQIL